MMKSIEVSARTEEDAIELALVQLGLSRDDVSVEIIERARSGFLGLKNTPALVKVMYEAKEERTEMVENFLTGLFERMALDIGIDLSESDDAISVLLTSKDPGTLIGRRGETLDAVQHLTNYVVNRGSANRVRVNIDAENYRKRRNDTLETLAVRTAEKVLKYRRNATLDPMNAYERHLIHSTLQDRDGISTFSVGSEPNRRVVVAYGRGSAGNSGGASASSARNYSGSGHRRPPASGSGAHKSKNSSESSTNESTTRTNKTQYREWS